MKKILLLSLGLFVLTACNNQKEKVTEQEITEEQFVPEQSLGGNRDAHGCLSGAGESWSELKQACVQVFTVGLRLNPINPAEGVAEISAFIISDADNASKVELFLATSEEHSIILEQSEDNVFKNNTYLFNANENTLYIDGEATYKAEN